MEAQARGSSWGATGTDITNALELGCLEESWAKLCLSFLTCKVGTVIALSTRVVLRTDE
jgi:hypothetical protein